MVMISNENKSLMKQLVITHIIHQTEIPALPDSWVTIELNLNELNWDWDWDWTRLDSIGSDRIELN